MKKWVAILLMVGLMAVGLIGCGSKDQPANAPAPADKQTETQSQSGNDLSSIMKKASQAKQMSFDMVMTMSGSDKNSVTSKGKMYVSDQKLRMELETMGMKMITISNDQKEFYLYNPDEKTALKMTAPPESADVPNEWAREDGDVSGFTVVGEEKKDGYDCVVVTFTEDGAESKMWIRKDIGMPVRSEVTSAEGTMVVEYKNYNMGAQPGNLFEIPAGTEITTMPSMPDMSQIPK